MSWACRRCQRVFDDLPVGEICPYDQGELTPVTDRSIFDEHTGRVYGDKYRVGHMLGAGGMGCVHQGINLRLDQPVAVKFFSPRFQASVRRTDGGAAERFRREATIMAKARHPNVVRVQDFSIETDGTMFLVMELLEGSPLDSLLARGGLSLDQVVSILQQVLKALEYVHLQGVIHRDLKPSNVFCALVGDRSVIKVLDFGIARIAGADTITDGPLGTWRYAAPEQLAGATVGCGADIFSLGVILHEMLVGGPRSQHDLGPEVPEAMRQVVERATAQEPDERYASAAELSEALTAALEQLTEEERGRLLPKPKPMDEMLPPSSGAPEMGRGSFDPTPVAHPLRGKAGVRDELLPDANASIASELTRAAADQPGSSVRGWRGRLWPPLAAALAAALLMGGAWLAWSRWDSDVETRSIAGGDALAGGNVGDDSAEPLDAGEPPAEVVPQLVRISFISTPHEAVVFLMDDDGGERELCKTSCLQELPQGEAPVKVIFRHSRYPDHSAQFIPDRDQIVELELSKRGPAVGRPSQPAKASSRDAGYLSVRAIPQSDVFLDGRPLGRSPIHRREIPAGRYQLKLVPRREVLGPGVSQPPKTLTITISPGQTKQVVEYW